MKSFYDHHSPRRWRVLLAAAALSLTLGPLEAAAQPEEDEKVEHEIAVQETTQQTERPTLEDEQQGPRFSATQFVTQRSLASLQRQDEAIVQLRDLIRSTPESDPQRAEYLFNLSEIFWERSRYYDDSAVERQDECYRIDDTGDEQAARRCRAQMEDMQAEAKRLREESVQLYVDIIRGYPDFGELDKVYFYLGSNLMDVGRKTEALDIFRELIANYPQTEFVPQVLLYFGEYYFDEGEMFEALKAYQKVAEYPESSVYPYGLYKLAWTYYNLENYERTIEVFLTVIDAARERPDDGTMVALMRQVRQDIVRAYAQIGSPDQAVEFFQDIAPEREDWLKMTERLAVFYGDQVQLSDSTRMYRELISLNQESVKTVDYQYEIVRNQTTNNAYSEESIQELVRMMRLVQLADGGQFEDTEEQNYPRIRSKVEEAARNWSTTYHREAQRTKNADLYAMAYYLYKFYLETFQDTEHEYMMTFFYGELLYQLENWEEAAAAYERVLELEPEGEYTKEAVLATVLAYFYIVDTSEERAVIEATFDEEDGEEETPAIPEPKELPEVYQKLMAACENYVEYVPDGDRMVDVKYTMARTYYDFDHLEKAATIFEDIAFTHSDHRLAVISANLHLDSLNLLQNFDNLNAAVERYIEVDPIEDAEFQEDVTNLHMAIRFKICTVHDDEEEWRQAAECFVAYASDFPDSEYVDKALYNAALDFERLREIGPAIQVRLHLLRVRPSSELAPETLFNIGGNYHALAVYSEASRFYEAFVRNFPDHEKAEDALSNASTFRQGLGQYDEAIANYERYMELFASENKQETAEVFFQIAQIYEEQGKKNEAFEQYQQYLRRHAEHGTNDRMLEARVKVGLHHWNNGGRNGRRDALEEFERTLRVYERMSEEERAEMTTGRDAAAQAKFMMAEDIFERAAALSIDSSDAEELTKKTMAKMEAIDEARVAYEEVIVFGRPDWAIAALYRIGSGYQNFAETFRDSPVPSRLTYEQQEIYRGILEDRASMIEDKAVEMYREALATARRANWFNQYSRQAEVALADLRPREFRKPSEMRASPVFFRDGFMRSGFIKDVEDEDILGGLGSEEQAVNEAPEEVESEPAS
ncbi:tetratricopeptide repeat protein [Lujinxingia vulgaris]|uniref:Tetratricopeptide repeat protein n=1 Tax=Lujinxingia vulgaris TaxID=2600176 RepID=A0A5C6WYQ3_9DELT|nr:tetratricopeptide repeat protein [Lujinxingia vulgaris]TXD34583.1 tetratricopeptide repeat protein [Lujinxingia vulgaris]